MAANPRIFSALGLASLALGACLVTTTPSLATPVIPDIGGPPGCPGPGTVPAKFKVSFCYTSSEAGCLIGGLFSSCGSATLIGHGTVFPFTGFPVNLGPLIDTCVPTHVSDCIVLNLNPGINGIFLDEACFEGCFVAGGSEAFIFDVLPCGTVEDETTGFATFELGGPSEGGPIDVVNGNIVNSTPEVNGGAAAMPLLLSAGTLLVVADRRKRR